MVNLGQTLATDSVNQVRTVSSAEVSYGFREVVGFSKGGSGEVDTGAKSQQFSTLLSPSTSSLPSRHGRRPVAEKIPPLRC